MAHILAHLEGVCMHQDDWDNEFCKLKLNDDGTCPVHGQWGWLSPVEGPARPDPKPGPKKPKPK